MNAPLCIDLYCGLGGWTEGFLAEGYDVVGFDVEQHVYGEHRYPAQLVLQDVRTLHGRQFKDAAIIVASPPCQKYSYMAMPWTKAKDLAKWYRDPAYPERLGELNELFVQPARIQREASEAAGRHIPMIQENVRGAQPWVGRSRWHYGSYHLWGDVPALMPMTEKAIKVATMGAGWYPPGHPKHVPGLGFNTHTDRATKNEGGSWFAVAHNTTSGHGQNPDGRSLGDGVKVGGGINWRDHDKPDYAGPTFHASKGRKAAAARIAKIPLELAQHIAYVYRPVAS